MSFGSTSAVVTSMGLVVGLALAPSARVALVTSLLVVGVADNLTDSLSIHLYQESEGLEQHDAFVATVGNFLVRLSVTATFVVLAVTLSGPALIVLAAIWGLIVLGALTTALARSRGSSVMQELLRHFAIAFVVIIVSWTIGYLVSSRL